MKITNQLLTNRSRVVLFILISILLYAEVKAESNVFKNVKFSVNVSQLVRDGKFNPATDSVYVRGWFNAWALTSPLVAEGNNIYSATLKVNENTYNEYKFFISTHGAENNGWEKDLSMCSCGSRVLNMGLNDIVLPVVYYNESDMKLARSSAHFNIYCTSQEDAIIDAFVEKIETKYRNITSALELTIPEKTEIRLYKSLPAYHNAIGRPEDPDGAVGIAYGRKVLAMVSPTVIDFNGAVDLLAHEFTHIANAWKTNVSLPNWINEGVATYYSYMIASKYAIRDLINSSSGKPSLASIENDFSNGGYGYSYTIAYYIAKTFGTHALANFLVNMDYKTLGYTDKIAFQNAWHKFLDVYIDDQTKQNVKFSIDLTAKIQANIFKPLTDKVYVRGSFNNWSTTTQLFKTTGNIYSVTIPLIQYSFYEYKFFITSAGAENSGWENNSDETTMGNRLLDLEGKTLILPVAGYNNFTAINLLTENDILIYSQNKSLIFSGLPYNSQIQIYLLNGSLIKDLKSKESQISIPLQEGIYIVRLGNFVKKVFVN